MPSDYKVGYRKPPRHRQFKKGQTGNPKGRPKGAKNIKTELAEELQEKIVVREDGKRMVVSRRRAIIKTLVAKALKGDIRAAKELVNLDYKYLPPDESQPEERVLAPEDKAILEDFLARNQRRRPASRQTRKPRKGKAVRKKNRR